MSNEETYIEVHTWNEQTGEWFVNDYQPRTMQEARELATKLKEEWGQRVRIVHCITVEV